jgi:hypothetical protein
VDVLVLVSCHPKLEAEGFTIGSTISEGKPSTGWTQSLSELHPGEYPSLRIVHHHLLSLSCVVHCWSRLPGSYMHTAICGISFPFFETRRSGNYEQTLLDAVGRPESLPWLIRHYVAIIVGEVCIRDCQHRCGAWIIPPHVLGV